MTRTPDRDPALPGELRDPRSDGRTRSGYRREYDAGKPRRSFDERLDGLVRDVGAFRAVALRDLIERQFDGHPFAARRGLARAERRGWVGQRTARGPKGGKFAVVIRDQPVLREENGQSHTDPGVSMNRPIASSATVTFPLHFQMVARQMTFVPWRPAPPISSSHCCWRVVERCCST